MLHNFETTLREENQLNPFMRFWCKISTSIVLNFNFLEYIKLAEIIVVQIMGQLKTSGHLTLLFSWKTNYATVWAHILICALGSIINSYFILQNFPYD
jgi:hypothetical protein